MFITGCDGCLFRANLVRIGAHFFLGNFIAHMLVMYWREGKKLEPRSKKIFGNIGVYE